MLATGNGTATITAKATDGSGKSASCKVNGTVLVDKMWFEISPYVINAGWSVNQGFWYTPDNAKSTAVTWSSGNKQVATVSSDGTVQSNYNWFGTATITAKAKDGGGAWASYVVDVRFIRMDWARIYNPPGRSLNVGEGYGLGVEYGFTGDEASYPHFSWSSSDTSIATVNGGWVTAKKAGTVTITAYAQDGSGCTASCTINVVGSSGGSSGGGNSNGTSSGGNSGGNKNNKENNSNKKDEKSPLTSMKYDIYTLGGLELVKEFEWPEDDFPYDSKESATEEDKRAWSDWETKAWWADFLGLFPDGSPLYWHYREGTGEDVEIDLEKAYNDDSAIKKMYDNQIAAMKLAVEQFYKAGSGTSFEIVSDRFWSNKYGGYPAEENWQKALGDFSTYGYAKVEINKKTGKASLNVTFYAEDVWDFNKGASDIGSGTPDNENGRFSVLGWAKRFKTYGSFTKTETWQLSELPDTSSSTGGNGR